MSTNDVEGDKYRPVFAHTHHFRFINFVTLPVLIVDKPGCKTVKVAKEDTDSLDCLGTVRFSGIGTQ